MTAPHPSTLATLTTWRGGVADLSDQVDELNSYVKIDNLGTLNYCDLFEVMTEWGSQYGTGETQFNVAIFHVMSTTNVENMPSSAFNYGNGFVFKGRDTMHAIMFSYQSPYSIATNGKVASASSWGTWTIK